MEELARRGGPRGDRGQSSSRLELLVHGVANAGVWQLSGGDEVVNENAGEFGAFFPSALSICTGVKCVYGYIEVICGLI